MIDGDVGTYFLAAWKIIEDKYLVQYSLSFIVSILVHLYVFVALVYIGHQGARKIRMKAAKQNRIKRLAAHKHKHTSTKWMCGTTKQATHCDLTFEPFE